MRNTYVLLSAYAFTGVNFFMTSLVFRADSLSGQNHPLFISITKEISLWALLLSAVILCNFITYLLFPDSKQNLHKKNGRLFN